MKSYPFQQMENVIVDCIDNRLPAPNFATTSLLEILNYLDNSDSLPDIYGIPLTTRFLTSSIGVIITVITFIVTTINNN